MKPGEFDDLVRQKFDQADFEYKPGNWEKLAEELDGQKKKNRGLLFWWMPLVGVAASVVMAFGVSVALRHGAYLNAPAANQVQFASVQHNHKAIAANRIPVTQAGDITAQDVKAADPSVLPAEHNNDNHNDLTIAHAGNSAAAQAASAGEEKTTGRTSAIPGTFNTAGDNNIAFKNNDNNNTLAKKKKAVIVNNGYYTFKDEDIVVKKAPKLAIILSGGVNYSSQSNGYMVGATARRMVNDKVYVEGDVAFIGTNNSHKVEYMDYTNNSSGGTIAGNSNSSAGGFSAKGVSGKSTDGAAKTTNGGGAGGPVGVLKTTDQSYNLYYAQVTPSIGYKVMSRLSVGVGPDFQQMLVDNRPAESTTDRGNIKVAPMFDIGFMGKTEVAVTKNMKAAVYYREGINNVITPTNKYIDRSYLQFQIKYNILNR